jgi:hypothetical protein
MNTKYFAGAFFLDCALPAILVIFLFFTATVETGRVGVITNFGKVTAG